MPVGAFGLRLPFQGLPTFRGEVRGAGQDAGCRVDVGGLVASTGLMIRYLAAGSRELDEAAPVDAGKVVGAGLALAALGLLAPAAFGGRIGQSYDVSFAFGPLGSPHLVTSLFFDVGVYLVVIGVMLDLARSLGAGIDVHEAEGGTPRAPAPGRVVA